MSIQFKTNLILLGLGLTGILSLLLSPLPVELPQEALERFSESTIKILALINPFILLSLAIGLGLGFAIKVGLHSRLITALIKKENIKLVALSQLKWGIPAGLLGGGMIALIEKVWYPYLPDIFIEKTESLNLSPFTRLLYGGITEEIIFRWGIMSLLVWIGWKIFDRKKETPRASIYWWGIIIAALLFAMGHLPVVLAIVGTMVNNALISYVIIGNMSFGIIAGWLFWKHGLEAAIIAHLTVHLLLMLIGL